MLKLLFSLAYILLLTLRSASGALVANASEAMSPPNGVMMHLRFSLVSSNSGQGSKIELSYLGQLALLNKTSGSRNLILTNSEASIMAFNIRKALYTYDSYAVIDNNGRVLVIPNLGDRAYKLYVERHGGRESPSTLVNSINGHTIGLVHLDSNDRHKPWVYFTVELSSTGKILIVEAAR